MLHAKTFLGVFALLVASLFLVQWSPPQYDVFTSSDDRERSGLSELTSLDVARRKFLHALSGPPYDVGVFGNSRAIMVSTADIALDPGHFFNFSVGGQSLRQSTRMLEDLAAAGKAPQIALISLDHLELNFYSTSEFPGFFARVSEAIDGASYLWGAAGEGPLSALKALVAAGLIETWLFTGTFSMDVLTNRVFFLLPAEWRSAPENITRIGIRADGSRFQPQPTVPPDITPIEAGPPVFYMESYLPWDIERLARLESTGIRVILYESPIDPGSTARFQSKPSPIAVRHRARVKEACIHRGMACFLDPPAIGDPTIAPYWRDATHAPAPYLGRYLVSLIEKTVPAP